MVGNNNSGSAPGRAINRATYDIPNAQRGIYQQPQRKVAESVDRELTLRERVAELENAVDSLQEKYEECEKNFKELLRRIKALNR